MDTQTAIDLVVISLPDHQVIEMIERNKEYMKDGQMVEKHQALIDMLILGIDRMYGAGCYHIYTVTGELPSQQV